MSRPDCDDGPCYSPVACAAFGYCRQRNLAHPLGLLNKPTALMVAQSQGHVPANQGDDDMTNINEIHAADIVITTLDGNHAVFMGGGIVAHATGKIAISLMTAGASARGLSVYDAEAGHFLCGTVAQMMA